jgi:hypothetical protein
MPRQERTIFWDETGASTRVRARFHGMAGRAYSGVIDGYRPNFGSIVGFQTSKNKLAPSGTWSMTVKRPDRMTHEQWMALWPDPEGTWVELDWICNGQTISGMLGNIDSVSSAVMTDAGGALSGTYTITGRDHGKVFENTTLWINLFDSGAILNNVAMYQTMEARIDGTPSYHVRSLIEAWIGNNRLTEKQWTLPPSLGNGRAFFDLLDLTNITPMTPADGMLIDPTLIDIARAGSSLWATMNEYANLLLNELFIDLAPVPGSPLLSGWRPSVFMRRMPFPTRTSRVSWDVLRTRSLSPNDVKSESVVRGGDANRFNYWQLRLEPQNYATDAIVQTPTGSPGLPGSNPVWSLESIRTHGLRRWEQSTKYLQLDNEGLRRTHAQMAAQWLLLCHDWYVVAPYQRSGTVTTTRAFPEIRIGERLRLNRANTRTGSPSYVDYYVEGVSTSWVHGQAGTTQINVTRGEGNNENHLQVAYGLNDYAAQTTAYVEGNQFNTPGAAPGAPPTLDQAIAEANREMNGDLLDEQTEEAPVSTTEASEADFNATAPDPSSPDMVNPLPPPAIVEGEAVLAYDESGGATEAPLDVAPEPGELSPAPPTVENVEDGRPVFIELDLEVQIGPGSAVVMGSDGLPVESDE